MNTGKGVYKIFSTVACILKLTKKLSKAVSALYAYILMQQIKNRMLLNTRFLQNW